MWPRDSYGCFSFLGCLGKPLLRRTESECVEWGGGESTELTSKRQQKLRRHDEDPPVSNAVTEMPKLRPFLVTREMDSTSLTRFHYLN
ncbi:hypothetical protein RRG08_012288 [Elysia crispata]|uniref:Uncharacterized protein n=1 Tax=Elysia crispata TaxID=231223 RepID=A0AAE1BB38_9GAST|nr:hypothetical protein RRG08_012288 [Elysia crispata]